MAVPISIINYENITEVHQKDNLTEAILYGESLFPDTCVWIKMTKSYQYYRFKQQYNILQNHSQFFYVNLNMTCSKMAQFLERVLWTNLLTVIKPRGKTQGRCLDNGKMQSFFFFLNFHSNGLYPVANVVGYFCSSGEPATKLPIK